MKKLHKENWGLGIEVVVQVVIWKVRASFMYNVQNKDSSLNPKQNSSSGRRKQAKLVQTARHYVRLPKKT
jgi:hypothetical protein